ncbi:MAG: hypothetical protein ACRDST_14245 [Pseudonocardiaceae bacterium]
MNLRIADSVRSSTYPWSSILGGGATGARDLLEQLDMHGEAVVFRRDQATGLEPLQRPADGALVQPGGVDQLRRGACTEHQRRHDAQPLGLGK